MNCTTSSVLPPDNRDHRGMETFDINDRSIYALRSCGVRHNGLERVCGLMNLPKPIVRKNYNNISDRFGDAAKFLSRKRYDLRQRKRKMEGSGNINVSVDLIGPGKNKGLLH